VRVWVITGALEVRGAGVCFIESADLRKYALSEAGAGIFDFGGATTHSLGDLGEDSVAIY
jgi:hypothetical protein